MNNLPLCFILLSESLSFAAESYGNEHKHNSVLQALMLYNLIGPIDE